MTPGDYKPDKRLSLIFDAIERKSEDVMEEVCPLFAELAGSDRRYDDGELLGKGGLKEVYKTFDCRTRQWVALARLRADRGLQFYDLFIREAWLVSSLNHPNIIKVHDAGSDEHGRPYFSMDLKRGTTLADLIQEGTTSRTELLEIFQKVCEAVAYAHDQRVIHLDLKPENIQCDRFGEVLVCDWGLGRSLNDDDVEPAVRTKERLESETLMGQVCGTLGYMAPEQVVSGRTKDTRTDVFALGCILHTILAGEPPFKGGVETVMKQTSASDIAPLRARFPERRIPAGLEAVVLKAASRNPENRYVSAIALKEEINKFLSGFSTAAEESGFFKEAALFMARNRKASTVTFIALIVVTVLSVLFVQRLGQQQMATLEEQDRANQLMSEVNVLSSEYSELFNESAVTRKELARKLALSANSLKNLSIFDRPVESVAEAGRLVDMALQLDPDCNAARWQRFNLYCIQLNFQAALQDDQVVYPRSLSGIKALVEAFPEYRFDEDNRPEPEQMAALLRHAFTLKRRSGGIVERIFAYQHGTSWKMRRGLSDEISALLEFYNGGPEHCSLNYHVGNKRMSIRSDVELFKLSSANGASGRSFLRYIPVRQLSFDLSGTLLTRGLNNLDIETLDLRNCENIKLEARINLPQLQLIRMRKGLFDPAELQRLIRSNEPFRIEVVD